MQIRNVLARELINEFLGTMILILIGDSIVAVIIAGGQGHNAHVIGPIGWGTAIFCAVFVAGGVSAHINPAVTLALASAKEFPLKKVPLFWLAQYLGAFVGAVLVYVMYRDVINHFDGGVRSVVGEKGTAAIFSTYPREEVTTLTCFFDQVISTAVLMLTVAAIVDERNFAVPKALLPLMLGMLIVAEIFAFSHNCMAALNPARDIGPRIFTAISGWGSQVFTFRNYQWVWVPIFGPHIGAIIGLWIYKLCIRDHWPVQEMTSLKQVVSAASNGDNPGKTVESIVLRPAGENRTEGDQTNTGKI